MAMSSSAENYDPAVIERRHRSVAHMFLHRVELTPQDEAFRYADGECWRSLTWAATHERVQHIAAGLMSLGVEAQDRVAIASATSLEWVLADLGVMMAGAATTTIYPTSQLPDVVHILNDSGSQVVFAEDAAQVAKLQQGSEQLADVRSIIMLTGELDAIVDGAEASASSAANKVMTLDQLEATGVDYLAEHPNALTERIDGIQPDHLATLIYTSGTTGKAKGVQLTHDCWTYESAAVDAVGILGRADVQYLWLPLSHVFGKMLLCLPIQIGFPTVIDGRVDTIIDNLPTTQPTWMGAAPRIFEKVYGKINTTMEASGGAKLRLYRWAIDIGTRVARERADGREPSGQLAVLHKIADKLILSTIRARFGGHVRFFISGSAALNKDVALWFAAVGMPILEGYGLSESSAAAAVNRPYLGANQAGTVGWPLPGTLFKLGEDGELLIKGPGVMKGYWNLPEETAHVLEDGWFHTGDIGTIADSGHIAITDRKKDLFKTSNGKYVAPGAIEALFKGICPYASNLVVEGDGRTFVSALITLDADAMRTWAEQNSMEEKSYEEVVTSPQCREMVQTYVDEMNLQLNRWEQVKRFIILPRDLSVEEGEITPSLKIKRRVVTRKFKDELDGLYTS